MDTHENYIARNIAENPQKAQIKRHLEDIVTYIESEILPAIPYPFETNEHGKRCSIALNGCYKNKIRFYTSGYEKNIDDLIFFDYALDFLKHWAEFKDEFLLEIDRQKAIDDLIENFSI